jgi:hypothetical protein
MSGLIQIALTLALLLSTGCSTIQSVTATTYDPTEADIPIEIGDSLVLDMKNQTEIIIAVTNIDKNNISGRVNTEGIEDEEPQLVVIPRDEIETIIKIETKDENHIYKSTVQQLIAIEVVIYLLGFIAWLASLL